MWQLFQGVHLEMPGLVLYAVRTQPIIRKLRPRSPEWQPFLSDTHRNSIKLEHILCDGTAEIAFALT